MQRALIGGIITGISCSLIGVFLTLRKESFISEAIAHSSLTGIAIGYLVSFEPIIFAFFIGILTAIFITIFQRKTEISSDAIIGVFFSFILSVGIVLLSFVKGYRPDLVSFLFGSILAISNLDIVISSIILIFFIIILLMFFKKFLYCSFDKIQAHISGINTFQIDLLIRIITAFIIIASIKMVGMILVTALIIVPASSAKLTSKSFKEIIYYSGIFSLFSVIFGLILSYFLNVPSGASIVIFTVIIFIIIYFLKIFTKRIHHIA